MPNWISEWFAARRSDPPQSLTFKGHRRIVAPIHVAIFEVDATRGFTLYVTTRRIGPPLESETVFGLVNYPVPPELKPFLGGASPPAKSDLDPEAVIYVGFHDRPSKVACKIVNVEGHYADFELSFKMNDLQYYDERARPTDVTGKFRARLGSWSEMERMPI